MSFIQSRRELMKLLGVGGVAFASGLAGCTPSEGTKPASAPKRAPLLREDFFFLQLSDTHWGYSGPANPESDTTLKRTVDIVNASPLVPDFIVFTGDLTHNTDDAAVRAKRMDEFKQIVSGLKVK